MSLFRRDGYIEINKLLGGCTLYFFAICACVCIFFGGGDVKVPSELLEFHNRPSVETVASATIGPA